MESFAALGKNNPKLTSLKKKKKKSAETFYRENRK
jgi:hypothetical protein